MWQPQTFQPLPQAAPQAWMPQSFQPLQANQATGQPTANGESPSPQNANVLNNQQEQNPVQSLNQYFQDKPDTYYGSILPFSRNEKTGDTSLALPEFVRSLGRGVTGMMLDTSGQGKAPGQNLDMDEVNALTMMSPKSVASPSHMALTNGEPAQAPIGNRVVNYLSQPSEAANIEDQNINQLMSPNSGKGSSLIAGFGARSPEELNQASDALKSSAGNVYKQMRSEGAVLNGDAANDLASNVDDALKQNLFIPQLNPKTLGIVQHLKDAIDQNGQIGLDELDQYRRLLSRVGNSEDGVSAGSVRSAIDDTVNGLTNDNLSSGTTKAVNLLNQGRAAYSGASRFEDVADVIAKANGDPNKIKQGLTNFLKNDKNIRGWNQDQIDAVRFAANTGIGENILKAFGKFGFDFSKSGSGNTVIPAIAAVGGFAPLAVGGTVARQAQKYIARGKAEQALEFLQGGKK